MNFKNALVYRSDFAFHLGGFAVEKDVFATDSAGGDALDLEGKYVIPGLVDIHFHGNSGADFSDGQYEGLVKIARYLAQNGITSFSPASMTLPEEQLAAAFATAVKLAQEKPENASHIRGITMEGPFFNPAKKGAQKADFLRLPDYDLFSRLNKNANNMVRLACVAPELAGALDFIRKVSPECTVSVAHTTADYDTAKAAFDAGASHVTHLFNAMPPLAHRAPGVIGAAAENAGVTAELITDGIHIHPSAIRAAFALFGAGRMVLVSDSMSACGMPNGEYELGGQKVLVSGRTATLVDGTLAGSATNLFDCMRTAISFNIRPEDAIRAATFNPARVIRADQKIGNIEAGKCADFIVCNPDWSIEAVYIGGRQIARK
ncbi:MAG: N-acetylglucosamine-6-phosphate deacetylase [Clostridiaceae bacterium]|nr:N-acetylglucosamine-6-phosphate deacetylase [Clostridiaceae bacterium]